jgi:hypothetical protein
MFADNGKPGDCNHPQLTLPHTHATKLIVRSLADPATNTPHTFSSIADVSGIVPQGCVLFHGCKDGSLMATVDRTAAKVAKAAVGIYVRKRRLLGLDFLDLVQPTQPATPAPAPVKRPSSYYHSGNLGDVIYALPAIRANGGGELVIGTKQAGSSGCMNPISRSQYNLLMPLLKAQPYITSTRYTDTHPGSAVRHDLNFFRNRWFDIDARLKSGVTTLLDAHADYLGVTPDVSPWLQCEPMPSDKIIVSRSLRHRNWHFPWRRVMDRYGDKLLFIGHDEEVERFRMCWGGIAFYRVRDFLDAARLIAGAKGFIGNQSFFCAVAIGLGAKVLQEVYPPSPDCVIKRDGFFTELDKFDKAL